MGTIAASGEEQDYTQVTVLGEARARWDSHMKVLLDDPQWSSRPASFASPEKEPSWTASPGEPEQGCKFSQHQVQVREQPSAGGT